MTPDTPVPAPLLVLGTPPAGLLDKLAPAGLVLRLARDLAHLLELSGDPGTRGVLLCPPLRDVALAAALEAIGDAAARPLAIVVGARDAELVATALRRGAHDYVFADQPVADVAHAVELALADMSYASRHVDEPGTGLGLEALVGRSDAARALREEVRKIARSEAMTVLVQGESGTGKDLVARLVHAESARAAASFVAINCSAIPESLLESELFGHEAGAFTDARTRRRGLIEMAHHGTLFLDEVAELPLALQAKLLRFLEDHRIRRLGGTREVAVDVRVIAGTNVDLAAATADGRFRHDLYYRLHVVPVSVPPLRERAEDIPLLADHFLARDARRYHKTFAGFDAGALAVLAAHRWPGNIRELKNAIERVVVLEHGPVVTAAMLRLGRAGAPPAALPTPAALVAREVGAGDDLNIERQELRALARALERAGGNLTEAGRLLGLSRDTVRHRMARHGLRTVTRVVADDAGALDAG